MLYKLPVAVCAKHFNSPSNRNNLPAQVKPLPAKPVLQVHVNEPGVSTQSASGLQGVNVKHSLISKMIKIS